MVSGTQFGHLFWQFHKAYIIVELVMFYRMALL